MVLRSLLGSAAAGSAAPRAAATTPVRRTRLNSKDATGTPVVRRRLNSRDAASSAVTPHSPHRHHYHAIPRVSSFSAGAGGAAAFASHAHTLGWCLLYLTALGLLQLLALALVGPLYSTTLTNVLHTVGTILSLHWIKGRPFDDTGRHAGRTLWEQLLQAAEEAAVASGGSDAVYGGRGRGRSRGRPSSGTSGAAVGAAGSHAARFWLLLLPTLLTYAACAQCRFQPLPCAVNLVAWLVALVAKLPAMRGVRLFGINRTVGIDDDDDGSRSTTPDDSDFESSTNDNMADQQGAHLFFDD